MATVTAIYESSAVELADFLDVVVRSWLRVQLTSLLCTCQQRGVWLCYCRDVRVLSSVNAYIAGMRRERRRD